MLMACSSHGTVSEEYDSDFDSSSHEDVEESAHKDSINESFEEQQNQIIVKLILKKTFLILFCYLVKTTTNSLGNCSRMVTKRRILL